MSTSDILNTLLKYVDNNAAGGHLNLPSVAFGSGGIQVAVSAFFAGEAFQVTLSAPLSSGETNVKVSGQGTNSPLSDLSVEADFSDGDDGVDLSFQATVTPDWTFSSAFPALQGTYFDKLELASGSLTFNSADSGGTLSLLGELSVSSGGTDLGTGFFEARHDDDGSGFLVGLVVPAAFSPGSLWPDLAKLFGFLTFSNSGLVVSTIEAKASDFPKLPMPSLPGTLKPGVTLFTSLELSGDGFGFLKSLFDPPITLDLSGYVDPEAPLESTFSARLPGSAGHGVLTFNGFTLTLDPAQTTFTLSASATLTINGESVTLEGDGTVIVAPTPTVDFSLQVEQWANPFGIQGLVIQEFGLNATVEDAGLELGFLGEIEIGTSAPFVLEMGGSLVDFEEPGALVFALKDPDPGNPLTLSDLVKEFTSLNLDRVPLLNGLAFKDLEFYVVADPAGSWTAPNGETFPDGIGLVADVLFQSWELDLQIQIQWDKGVVASGSISEPITLLNVLTLSDATGAQGPSAAIDTSQLAGTAPAPSAGIGDASPYFSMSGAIQCLGLSESFQGSVSDDGFDVNFSASLSSLFTASFAARYARSQSFSGSARGSFDLDLDVPELTIDGVSIIPAVHIDGPAASLDIAIALSTSGGSVSLELTFTWGSFNFDVKFSLDAQQMKDALSNLWNHITAWIETNLRTFYQDVLKDMDAFVDAIKDGVLKLGQDAEYVAGALKAAFNTTAKEAAEALLRIGYLADDIVDALVKVFEISEAEAVGYVKKCAMSAARSFIYGG